MTQPTTVDAGPALPAAEAHANRTLLIAGLAVLVTFLDTTVLFVAFLVIRGVIFHRFTFRWDSHAYGSLVWTTMVLHTVHVVTGTCENLLFIVLLTRGPVEDKHMDDLWLNSLYWYFVVACWVPFYAIFFLDPGLLATVR